MFAFNRLDNQDDEPDEPDGSNDEAEIIRLVRKLQKTLLRRANFCADQNIIGEALALSEGARSVGEIACNLCFGADVHLEADDDDLDEDL